MAILAVLLTFAFDRVFCQEEKTRLSWEDFVEMTVEGAGDDGGTLDEEALERLYELYSMPLEINSVTEDDLLELPFLSKEQVNDIMQYVMYNSPVQSMGEMMYVVSLDKETRALLRLFVVAEPRSLAAGDKAVGTKELFGNAKNEAVWRTDVPFYERAGFADYPAEVLSKSPNKVYRGDALHHTLRYSLSSMNRLSAGVNMEKDAGERGIDYVSGYVMLRDMGFVKRAVVGNYRVSFGQGLAVSSSMKYGKMMMIGSTDRIDAGITRHSSNMESGYFTGAAATACLGKLELSAFGSWRKLDGNYTSDSTGITSLKTDGLHRTKLELSKKGIIGTTNVGGNIHWGNDNLRLSATVIATHFSLPLKPKYNTAGTLYRRYNAQGSDFLVGSMAYALRLGTLSIAGETAYSCTERQCGVATLNSLRWRVDGSNTLTLIGRYYGAKFVSLNGRAFGENAAVQNEEGVFVGWRTSAFRNMVMEAYFDAMHFPWMKSQVSGSSNGYEAALQTTCTISSRCTLFGRYRMKSKQYDYTYKVNGQEYTNLRYKTTHSLKIQLNCQVTEQVSLRTVATGVAIAVGGKQGDVGYALGESVRWQGRDTKMRVDCGVAYFNTDSYEARVYGYEPGLLYSFASTSYFYQGLRLTMLACVPVVKDALFLNAKIASVRYFNRSTIGSGLDLINANHREDLQVQLRWLF